ncbi:MAG: hypothetical protein ACRDQ5_09130 [Sciscionella sp.]
MVELANLEDTARDWMPRLFALYGIHRRSLLPDEDPPCFVGWGMEFPGMQKAVLWLSHGDTWRSSSATSLLEQMTRFADTRLLWLDSPDDHEPLAATS